MKKTLNIVGESDWYDQRQYEGGIRGLPPFDFKVTYDKKFDNEISIFVDKKGMKKVSEVESVKKVALIRDCRWVISDYYEYFEENHEKFDHIITYDDKLVELFPDKVWVTPAGGSFIWPKHKQSLHPKTKICSYIASKKNWSPLQAFRVGLIRYVNEHYTKYDGFIDVYGEGHKPLKDVVGKVDSLADYAFSIAIENIESNYYFSEKLLDCFLAGTIPIYFGHCDLSKHFNMDGVISLKPAMHFMPCEYQLSNLGASEQAATVWKQEVFPTIDPIHVFHGNTEDGGRLFPPVNYSLDAETFKQIIGSLSLEEYNRRLPAVQENFELAKKYIDSIDYALGTYYDR